MKQILKRIFNHEELSREEACSLMQDMIGGSINDTQTAALLAAFPSTSQPVPVLSLPEPDTT